MHRRLWAVDIKISTVDGDIIYDRKAGDAD